MGQKALRCPVCKASKGVRRGGIARPFTSAHAVRMHITRVHRAEWPRLSAAGTWPFTGTSAAKTARVEKEVLRTTNGAQPAITMTPSPYGDGSAFFVVRAGAKKTTMYLGYPAHIGILQKGETP